MTSGLYRTDTSNFLFSDFGRPRMDLRGTIAASCFFVSGCASGSDFAAARIFAFSAAEGMRITRLVVFGIVPDLFALGISKANNSADFASIYKCNIVKIVAFRYEPNHSGLIVIISIVDPDECFIPNQLLSERQGQTVLSAVQSIFNRIEVDAHTIM